MADPTFTIYVRLPSTRGDFIDPPPIEWDSLKDDELWNIISGAAKTEIDWNDLASRFDVTVPFLLQQVAYLTERHTSQLRAQVRKATAAAAAKGTSNTPSAPSPIPSHDPTSSAAGHVRTVSALSIRRDSPRADGSTGAATPTAASYLRPNISRNASTNTAVNTLGGGGGSHPSPRPTIASLRGEGGPSQSQSQRRRLSSLPIDTTQRDSPERVTSTPRAAEHPSSYEPLSPSSPLSSSPSHSSESSEEESRIIRRPPRFQNQQPPRDTGPGDLGDDEEETDAEPAFAQQQQRQRQQSPSGAVSAQGSRSTLRGDPKGAANGKGKATHYSETSDSSTTSSPAFAAPGTHGDGSVGGQGGARKPQGTLSPRRTGDLAGRSHRQEGSDGTPSMGSSFSDLDDASVTQSALEEALASKMQDGAVGSRFSISQAFKSRYIPKGGQR